MKDVFDAGYDEPRNALYKLRFLLVIIALVFVILSVFEFAGVINAIPEGDFFRFIEGEYGNYCVHITHKKSYRHMDMQGYLGGPNEKRVPFFINAYDPNGNERLRVKTVWLSDSNDPAADAELYKEKLAELTDTNNLEAAYAHVLEHGEEICCE